MAVDKGLVGGSTVLMLLSLLAEKDCYGYEIIKEISARSQNVFQFKEGTLYPVLHRMESQNLVKSYRAKTENGSITVLQRQVRHSLQRKRSSGKPSAVLWSVS